MSLPPDLQKGIDDYTKKYPNGYVGDLNDPLDPVCEQVRERLPLMDTTKE